MTALWTDTPEACELLAEAVTNPPPQHPFRYGEGRSITHDCRYTGPLVWKLRKLRNAFLEQSLKDADQSRDCVAFARNSALTVTKAIDEAREAAGYVADFQESFRIGRAA